MIDNIKKINDEILLIEIKSINDISLNKEQLKILAVGYEFLIVKIIQRCSVFENGFPIGSVFCENDNVNYMLLCNAMSKVWDNKGNIDSTYKQLICEYNMLNQRDNEGGIAKD